MTTLGPPAASPGVGPWPADASDPYPGLALRLDLGLDPGLDLDGVSADGTADPDPDGDPDVRDLDARDLDARDLDARDLDGRAAPDGDPDPDDPDSDPDLDADLVDTDLAGASDGAGAGLVGGRRRGDRDEVRATFGLLRASPVGSRAWHLHRDTLVRRHLPLVHFLARRFRGRGEPVDDLLQVATIGLIKAVDRFDLDRGVEFSTYATPTVIGEIKRHFRDRGWAIRVPRRVQEHVLAVSRTTGDLFGVLARSPTIAEVAAHARLSEEEVLEAIECSRAYSTVSLDARATGPDDPGAPHPAAGDAQAALENVEDRAALRPLLNRLDHRERQIVLLRFFANMTQSEIAAEVGLSQMHVSRLLSRTLARLREGLAPTGSAAERTASAPAGRAPIRGRAPGRGSAEPQRSP